MREPIVVTGAAGFVGACLTRRLVQEGAEVHSFVRQASNRWRLEDLAGTVSEHAVDLLDREMVKDAVSRIRPRTIVHCATFGGYPLQTDPDTILRVNVIGTMNLLDAANQFDYDCFINTGSSSEYGLKSKAMAEKDILEPVSTYAATKAAATLLCQSVARTTGRPIVTVRPFSVYGYYEEPTRLIPSVVESCLDGRDPELTAGEQVRDFIFVDDLCDLYLRVADRPLPAAIFNGGSGVQRSVREAVETIVRLTGGRVAPKWGALPTRPFEAASWAADLRKVRSMLGWAPRVSFEEGLLRTIEWHRERRSKRVGAGASAAGKG